MGKTHHHSGGATVTAENLEEAQNIDPANDPAPAAVESVAEAAENGQAPAGDLQRVTEERDQLKERLVRLQAEFENARKREARERAGIRDFAVAEAIKPLLPALDHFHLALDAEGSPEQLRSGVELIVKQMEDALRTLGIEPVEAVGAEFNPHLHEALGTVETADVPDHHVVDELRRGYKFKDKLLRPAQVRVASNPQQKEA